VHAFDDKAVSANNKPDVVFGVAKKRRFFFAAYFSPGGAGHQTEE